MRRLLGIVLLVAALGQLSYRGMQRVRHELPLWDFVNPYAASRAWINGTDPYFRPNVVVAWHQTHFLNDRDWTHWASVYPPTSLAMIAPLAALPPRLALSLWFAITILLLTVQFIALTDLMGWKWRDPKTLLLVGATLFAAPTQFALISGQLSMPAISLCIIAYWCATRGRHVAAGVLIGIACALKPQVAGIFVLFYLLLREWKISMTAIVAGGLITLGAVSAMQIGHPDWLSGWLRNIAATTEVGAVNDYSWSGHFRDHIIDLKMLLVSWIEDPIILRSTIALIALALLAWFVRAIPRRDQRTMRTELLTLATLCAISLLPIYHRVYDAALLVTALAWALAELDGRRRRYAIAILIAMSPLLIPFDLAHMLGHRAPRLAEITQTDWWQTWLAPHFAWGLVAASLVSLLTLTRETASQRVAVARPVRETDTVDLEPGEDDEDIALAH